MPNAALHLSRWATLGQSSDMDFALGTSWLMAPSASKFLTGIHPDGAIGLLDWEVRE